MSVPAVISLDIQIAVLRDVADEASSYAKACAASRWPMPGAQLRAEALRAALQTIEAIGSAPGPGVAQSVADEFSSVLQEAREAFGVVPSAPPVRWSHPGDDPDGWGAPV